MKVLMGIGNELRGDDAIGIYVARNFRKVGWKVIVAGQVPEDFTSEIKNLKPDILIMVDAALMNLPPGEIRIVPAEKIPKVAFSTHGMPLSFFMEYIEEYVKRCLLIGIQPKSMEFGVGLSEEVKAAGDELIQILKEEKYENIDRL
ncbi:hydrogenase maturation peptidase HycI [Euryarchaeota archaeon ex4484_178]|nr:MAG: hydrogenase maturation peptidase HycI [Euryarchaeota archaeon ex4484_178]